MEITGKVCVVLPVENGVSKSGNSWQKQNFVIEMEGQYPKRMCFQLFGDKVGCCPVTGDVAKVSFDAESREYNGRWYTQLNAWKVEKMQTQSAASSQPTPAPEQPQEAVDDLPF